MNGSLVGIKRKNPFMILCGFFAGVDGSVTEEYKDDPDRCCPWCTESERRQAVHAGNERKQAEFAGGKVCWSWEVAMGQEPSKGESAMIVMELIN